VIKGGDGDHGDRRHRDVAGRGSGRLGDPRRQRAQQPEQGEPDERSEDHRRWADRGLQRNGGEAPQSCTEEVPEVEPPDVAHFHDEQ